MSVPAPTTTSLTFNIARNVVLTASAHLRVHAHPASMATPFSVTPASHAHNHQGYMEPAADAVREPRVQSYHALTAQKLLIITRSCSVAGVY